ncbi:uncharacterized protein LOC115875789 [Sitophilus oryzae]|uniref:Uncharacterized protein LOC115875789 n=1 Tax=Sitophilus oryzae TaxID=7048 RepID=A0A6J2X7I9_SITOR|nr:uncharacterized protein LOC115875789 [Sitophilus oryzae]
MVMDRHQFTPNNIYNVDETGCTTVQKPGKVISKKGIKEVGGIVSQERGSLVTMCIAINALGQSIPPMFIFPLKRYHEHFVRDGSQGSIGGGNKSGWMQEENFLQFIKHFAKYAKPSEENRVLLILDNHTSHLFIPVIDFCKSNFITLLSFPPHTSHKLQPLDRGVFGPFKRFFNNECDQWVRSNPGKRMTIYNIPALAKDAYLLAMTPKNITAGFQCTGIWPFNRYVFSDAEFDPSSVTDRPLEDRIAADIVQEERSGNNTNPSACEAGLRSKLDTILDVSNTTIEAKPSTSKANLSSGVVTILEDIIIKGPSSTSTSSVNNKQHTIGCSTPPLPILKQSVSQPPSNQTRVHSPITKVLCFHTEHMRLERYIRKPIKKGF